MTRLEKIDFIKAQIEEKKNRIDDLKRLADMNNAMQLGIKLVLNGTYGAFLNKNFVCYCDAIGSTITSHGRDLTRTMNDENEKYWYEDFHKDINTQKSVFIHSKVIDYIHENNLNIRDIIKEDKEYDGLYTKEYDDIVENLNLDFSKIEFKDIKPLDNRYVDWVNRQEIDDPTWDQIYEITGAAVRAEPVSIYADTDSLINSTLIHTNKSTYTIENLYNKYINFFSGKTLTGHESVMCDENVLNYKLEKGLYFGKVKRLIRHKVSKSKWKLKTKLGKEVIVTNDHSMIVFRDGIQLVVKPSEIINSDKILTIFRKS